MKAARTEPRGIRPGMALVALVLFAGGVSWMSGEGGFGLGFLPTLAALVGVGYLSGRWWSVLFALILIPAALVADWLAFGIDLTRQDEYEPLPATPFVIIGMPVPMLLVALGVIGRRLRNRHAQSRH